MSKQALQDEFTLTLRQPITLGTGLEAETYLHLALREPVADEVLDFNRRSAKDAGDALRYLIARVSGVPLAVIGKLKARDFTKAANYLVAFMDPDLSRDDEDDEDHRMENVLGK